MDSLLDDFQTAQSLPHRLLYLLKAFVSTEGCSAFSATWHIVERSLSPRKATQSSASQVPGSTRFPWIICAHSCHAHCRTPCNDPEMAGGRIGSVLQPPRQTWVVCVGVSGAGAPWTHASHDAAAVQEAPVVLIPAQHEPELLRAESCLAGRHRLTRQQRQRRRPPPGALGLARVRDRGQPDGLGDRHVLQPGQRLSSLLLFLFFFAHPTAVWRGHASL